MRFIKDNLLLLTLCLIVGVATLDSKNVLAGGDPSIKDSKVKKQKSNIKQHDHDKIYVDKQKKLSSTKNKKNTNNNSALTKKNSNKDIIINSDKKKIKSRLDLISSVLGIVFFYDII